MDIGDIVKISEIETGTANGNHHGLEGFMGEILQVDLSDNTAFVDVISTRQRLWLNISGLTVVKSKTRCLCGGVLTELPLFTSIIKVCSVCEKEAKT